MRYALLTILILAASGARAQGVERTVASMIDRVTVFQQGAQVTRTATTTLPAGASDLKFTGITSQLDPESIQLRAQGAFTVLSVVHRRNFFEDPEQTETIEALRAKRAGKEDSVRSEDAMLKVFVQEEEMLLANRSIGSAESGVQVAELQAAVEFFRSRLEDIKSRQLAVNRSMEKLRREIADIDQQLNELGARQRDRYTSEITVAVVADRQTNGRFELSYITPRARWYPQYDVRVQDVESPIVLAYNANVVQSSGEDWKDARLTLSTGDPSRGGTRPELSPWWLSFLETRSARKARSMVEMEEAVVAEGMVADSKERPAAPEEPAALAVPVQEVVNTTTVQFEIDVPYSVPSDGKPYAVTIRQHEVPATYEYYCAPKLDRDAFLTARVTEWEEYNLLSGEANLFFEGTFVGKSFMDTRAVTDTLVLSLGRDAGVVVERTRQKVLTRRSFLGTKEIVSLAFDIDIRNNKRVPVRIVVEDQVPVSTDRDIEVESKPDDRAELDRETGLVRWRLDLAPAASEKVSFRYEVKYPRGRTVILE